jgi:hypothetical protein
VARRIQRQFLRVKQKVVGGGAGAVVGGAVVGGSVGGVVVVAAAVVVGGVAAVVAVLAAVVVGDVVRLVAASVVGGPVGSVDGFVVFAAGVVVVADPGDGWVVDDATVGRIGACAWCRRVGEPERASA